MGVYWGFIFAIVQASNDPSLKLNFGIHQRVCTTIWIPAPSLVHMDTGIVSAFSEAG